MSNSDTNRTVAVDDELEEAVHWVERELREARRALWDGKSGKAFASIEAAQDEFETIEDAIADAERSIDTESEDVDRGDGPRTDGGSSESGTYQCPYPDCEWSPSRPTDSEVRLTQVVVSHEIDNHRKEHTATNHTDAE